MSEPHPAHRYQHAFTWCNAQQREGLLLLTRRNLLKASLAGMAGLTLPALLAQRARASSTGKPIGKHRSVILLWMAGGPSHIDTLDPKPDRPAENRGPFGTIATRLPGVRICEHLPKLGSMLDHFSVLRSVDARGSNHEPNAVFQTGNREAEPRVNRTGHLYPAIGSIVSKYHGSNHPALPAYAAFMTGRSHLAFAGYLGRKYDPFIANHAAELPIYTNIGVDTGQVSVPQAFRFAEGVSPQRMQERQSLVSSFDQMRRELDQQGNFDAMDSFQRQAMDMLTGRRARDAFDLSREPEAIRQRYGKHLWCQQALLARRLVEAGCAFVTLDLSYHSASGTWDTHGDNIPPYGGISKGLKPLLPLFDHLITTLVADLEQRGLLDEVLVIAMGEFGRTPQLGTQGSTDGRNHWPVVMSMLLAGGGFRHGQVIGATDKDGGQIKERPITPGDLAATIYHHMGVPLDTAYLDHGGRPRPIVEEGHPLRELV